MRADPARLTQVVSNLLDNAIKFTPSGGSVVVRLTEHPSRDRAELSIQDTGIGMEAGFAARAFESFAQQESGRDRRSGGLGLGLSLVRGLVRLHGGAVQADSDGPGQGCTITLTLPLQTNELVTNEPPPTAPSI
jgi:signal transduction histidine kinase